MGRSTGGASGVGKPGTANQFQRRELVAVPVLRRISCCLPKTVKHARLVRVRRKQRAWRGLPLCLAEHKYGRGLVDVAKVGFAVGAEAGRRDAVEYGAILLTSVFAAELQGAQDALEVDDA